MNDRTANMVRTIKINIIPVPSRIIGIRGNIKTNDFVVDVTIIIDSPEMPPDIPMMNSVPYTSMVSINGGCAFLILTEIIINRTRLGSVETIALEAEMSCILQRQIICMRMDLLEEFIIAPLIIVW